MATYEMEIPGIGVHVVSVAAGTVEQRIVRYRANPNVEFAEPDFYRVLIIPDEGNDPWPGAGGVIAGREYFSEQWGMHSTGQLHTSFDLLGNPIQVSGVPDADIDAPEGWGISCGEPSVKIAILDTCIDCDSVEHAGKCVEEISFVGDYSDYLDDPGDYVGHGTHVAGIAAVHTDNGIGVAGVGWNSSLGYLKTCDDGFLDGMELAAGHDPLLASDAPLWGDTDDDGVVNGADIVRLTRAVLGLTTLSDAEKARVDIAPVVAGTPAPDRQVTLGDLLVYPATDIDPFSGPGSDQPCSPSFRISS